MEFIVSWVSFFERDDFHLPPSSTRMRTKDRWVLLVVIFAVVMKDSSTLFEIKTCMQGKKDVSCVIYGKYIFVFKITAELLKTMAIAVKSTVWVLSNTRDISPALARSVTF